MRIAMMGSGGIGGYLGARLTQASEDVTFIARGAHLEAMQQSGLRLQSPLGNINLSNVKATGTPGDVGVVDIVVFAVKMYDAETAAAAIVPLVGPETRVVTLQNGIDSSDIIARHVPGSQIVGGATYLSAYLERPGLIIHAGGVTEVITGGHNDRIVEALRDSCIRAGGVDLKIVENIDQVLWAKFVTISAFSGASSLIRAGIGPILADAESQIFIEQLRDEGIAVASAAGHPVPDGFEERIMSLWRSIPPEIRSSMCNDLTRGRPIELNWLSGRMHTLGKEFGVPTPAHTAVYRALHLHAAGSPLKQDKPIDERNE